MGRINFGRAIKDFKGITNNVTVKEDRDGYPFICDLKNWEIFNLNDNPEFYDSMEYFPIETFSIGENGRLPIGVYRGTFNVNKPSDTFLNFETWGKVWYMSTDMVSVEYGKSVLNKPFICLDVG